MILESIQNLAFVVITVFFALATITILLRIYSRAVLIKGFGWDDWCMISVLVFNAGHQAILYIFLENGAGLHFKQVLVEHPQHLQHLVFALFAEEIMYTFMHFIVKTAFLLFYLRFATKTFRKLVYFFMVLNFLCTLTTMLIYGLQCLPLDAFFHPALHPDVKCLNKNTQAFVPASFSIFLDVVIVVLPIRSLWAIQVSVRKRIALISILSLGGIVVVISCIRLAVLLEFDPDPSLSDFTYVLGKLIIISSIELEVAIMAANAPSLKTVMEKWFGKGNGVGATTNGKYAREGESRSGRSGRGRNEHGYSVDCVPMGDIKRKMVDEEERPVAPSRMDNRLRHTSSEEQLWKQDSGIIVERSVGVEVSEVSDGDIDKSEKSSEKGSKRGSGVRDMSRGKTSTTPPIEEEEEDKRPKERKMFSMV